MQDHCSNINRIVVKAFVVLVKFLPASIDVRAEMLYSCEVSDAVCSSEPQQVYQFTNERIEFII